MTFKIVVLVKQVPDTTDIKWTKDNTIQRDGLESVVNPYDVGAIYIAKRVKELLIEKNIDVEITAVSMGPNQAQDVLSFSLACGCDKAALLSDKKFSGADTLATAYTLYSYIDSHISNYNLILCGQQAVDGDTAQTPSSLAQKLGISQITNVTDVTEITPDYAIWIKETNRIKQKIKANYPVLIATTLNNIEMHCKIDDYINAQDKEIEILSSEDINAQADKVGFKGSPTIVKKAYRPEIERNTQVLKDYKTEDLAELILTEINNCKSKESDNV